MGLLEQRGILRLRNRLIIELEMEIEELQTREEWQEAFHVMRELRRDLDEQGYLCILSSMVKEGYLISRSAIMVSSFLLLA